jgi:hypothetical protein
MELASAIIGAAGDLLVLIALLVAVRALTTANGARADAQESDRIAVTARTEAAEAAARATDKALELQRLIVLEHQVAAMERRRQRVVEIGELVEDIYWTALPAETGGIVYPNYWMPKRNRLGHLLVGVATDLPECAQILNAATNDSALEHSRKAREEVGPMLQIIDQELRALQSSRVPDATPP